MSYPCIGVRGTPEVRVLERLFILHHRRFEFAGTGDPSKVAAKLDHQTIAINSTAGLIDGDGPLQRLYRQLDCDAYG